MAIKSRSNRSVELPYHKYVLSSVNSGTVKQQKVEMWYNKLLIANDSNINFA